LEVAVTTMTLDRALQSQGFGSRKECRIMVHNGRVLINGKSAESPDQQVDPATLTLSVDGSRAWPYSEQLYLAFNKPIDIECSHQPTHHKSLFGLLPKHFVARGVQSVGRLDADTSGLLLLSDDGKFVHALSSPKKKVPKLYLVQTGDDLTDAQLSALNAGVMLRDDPEPAAGEARRIGPRALELIIDEGRYHQVKRMLGAVGNRVVQLHRERIGGYGLPSELAPGQWVELTAADLAQLRAPSPPSAPGQSSPSD